MHYITAYPALASASGMKPAALASRLEPTQEDPRMAARRTERQPQLVTPQIEEILKAVHFYRYVTALDITHLFYSPTVLPYVRQRLTNLAGGRDFAGNQFLYRFPLPSTSAGNPQRIYTLGSRGRAYLIDELGFPVEWYYRPHKVRDMGYSQMLHNIILTKCLVAARRWVNKHTDFGLVQTRISYELAERPSVLTIAQAGETITLKVIPDAWLMFRRLSDERHFPILLEIDRGTQYQKAFKNHVRSRIEYLRCGAYRETFGTEAVIIAYATTGATRAIRETRCNTLCVWTREVLAEMHLESWASVFRFHPLAIEDIYNTPVFDEAVWYQPLLSAPLPLFEI